MKQRDKPLKRKDLHPYPLKLSVSKSDASENSEISGNSGKHKLATIMFSDICGFTKMMGKDEVRTMQLVERNLHIHRKYIHIHNGILIKEMGDGLMASFESAHDAVRCAKEIMDEVVSTEEYNLHIGIHLGDIIFKEDDIYGDGVNIAARINSCAREGEIIVSEEVWKNIRNQTEFSNEYLGKRSLKNVDQPVKLHRVLLDDEKRKIQIKAILYTHSKEIKLAVAIVLIISVILTIYYFIQTPYSMTGNELRTIAVLPFESKTRDPGYDYLKEGLAEDVISQLFNLSSYTVISSRSSFQFKNSDKPLEQISEELKADILLIGNFQVIDREIEVKIEVVGGRQNEILNYATIGANFDDIKSVSKQIGQALYQTLNITSGKSESPRKKDSEIINIEAYKFNAMGKSAMYDHTGQKREDIIKYFQAAIDIDSTYVDPYLGIAESYIFDANRGYISPAEAAQKAREYALIAEKLRPGCGEVSSLLGIIYYLNWEFKKAIPYFERSLEVSPNYYMTYHYYAFCLEVLGTFDKSTELLKKATVIDPLNAFNDTYLAVNYMFQGKLNEAHKITDAILTIEPYHAMSLWIKAILLNQEQKYEEALKVLEKRELGLETNFIAGYTYAMLGKNDKAATVLNNLYIASQDNYVPPTQIAIVYCGLNDKEKAIEKVEEAFLVHDLWIGYLKFTHFSDPIKDDPRYISLINELGWK